MNEDIFDFEIYADYTMECFQREYSNNLTLKYSTKIYEYFYGFYDSEKGVENHVMKGLIEEKSPIIKNAFNKVESNINKLINIKVLKLDEYGIKDFTNFLNKMVEDSKELDFTLHKPLSPSDILMGIKNSGINKVDEDSLFRSGSVFEGIMETGLWIMEFQEIEDFSFIREEHKEEFERRSKEKDPNLFIDFLSTYMIKEDKEYFNKFLFHVTENTNNGFYLVKERFSRLLKESKNSK